MASSNPVIGYVECPKCSKDMQVKKTKKGRNPVAKKLGYCSHCRHMLQGNAHQDFLNTMRAVDEPEPPAAAPVVEPEVFEDFDPAELAHPVKEGQEQEETPAKRDRAGSRRVGWVSITLGVIGFVVLGVGAANAMSQGS